MAALAPCVRWEDVIAMLDCSSCPARWLSSICLIAPRLGIQVPVRQPAAVVN